MNHSFSFLNVLNNFNENNYENLVANPTIDFLCPLLKSGKDGKIPRTKTDLQKNWAIKNESWPDDPQRAIEDILKTVQTEDSCFLLYKDRTEAVAELSVVLKALDEGKLTGNSSNHLLVGPKSVGKTSFLQGLVFAMQKLGKRTISAYVDVSKHLNRDGPYDLIFKILETMLPSDAWDALQECKLDQLTDLQSLMIFLEKVKWRIFLVLDEYSEVYTLPPDEGAKWVFQLSSIGNWSSKSNPVNVLLSGSAPYLRSLCFGKMTLDEASRRAFPSYTGRANNLNSDRFHVIDIKPLFLKTDLELAYTQLFGKEPTTLQLSEFYFYTGGFLRNFSVYKRMVLSKIKSIKLNYLNTFCFKVKKHQPQYGRIIEKMMQSLFPEDEGVDSADLYSDPWGLMKPMDVNILRELGLDTRILYEGSDNGAFLYQQTNAQDTIRFSYPMTCLILKEPIFRNEWPSWFTSHIRVCLRYPYSILGIKAELVVRQSIIEKDWGFGSMELGKRSDSDLLLKVVYRNKTRTRIRDVEFPVSDEIPYGAPLQEIPDCKGADVVIFQNLCEVGISQSIEDNNSEQHFGCHPLNTNNEGNEKLVCCMHRLQIKLGSSSFGLTTARKTITKFKRGVVLIDYLQQKYKSIKFIYKLHLVTTRPLTDQALSLLTDNNVIIHDRIWLYLKWSQCVIDWANSCNIKCYCPCESDKAESDVADDDSDDDDDDDISATESISSNEDSDVDDDK